MDIIRDILGILGWLTSAVIVIYFHKKQLNLQKPEISFSIYSSSYTQKIEDASMGLNKGELDFNLTLLFKNSTNAPGSVTDIIAKIRYHGSTLEKYPSLIDMINHEIVLSNRPENIHGIIPIKIDPYGARKIKIRVCFKDVFISLVDRCNVPIDFKKPEIPKWENLPLLINIYAKYVDKTIEVTECVFRYDLEDSKRVHGTINMWENWKLNKEFAPNLKLE